MGGIPRGPSDPSAAPRRALDDQHLEPRQRRRSYDGRLLIGRGALLFALAFIIGAVGAVCGIGGGLFVVPLLHFGFKLPLRQAVATGLCLVFATAVASTAAELLHDNSALLWEVVLPLVGGALVGAQFGFVLSKRVNERLLKGVFTVLLCVIGIRMLVSASVPAAAAASVGGFGFVETAGLAVLGMMAGTLSPLLGIGGGLIIVPTLLLTMPEIGGNGARSASLAIGCFTSLRSIQLYMKERIVDMSVAPWIAFGALLGASLGVQFAHLPGASALGQRVFGFILLTTAVRFGNDAFRSREPALGTSPEFD